MPSRRVLIISILVAAILWGVTFLLHQHGTLSEIQNAILMKANPYQGIYHYDKSKIKNGKILESVSIAEQQGYPRLTLSIAQSGASLLGYQFDSRVRNRFFTVCLTSDNRFILNSGMLGVMYDDYCKVTDRSKEYQLRFTALTAERLLCENCEQQDYPRYWVKEMDSQQD